MFLGISPSSSWWRKAGRAWEKAGQEAGKAKGPDWKKKVMPELVLCLKNPSESAWGCIP